MLRKPPTIFKPNQENFVKKLFIEGEEGHKWTPEAASEKMQDAQNDTGDPLFEFNEWLEPSQIKYDWFLNYFTIFMQHLFVFLIGTFLQSSRV